MGPTMNNGRKRQWPRVVGIALALGFCAWLVSFAIQVAGAAKSLALSRLATLEVEYLLGPERLRAFHPLHRDFDIASDGSAVFGDGARLYALDKGSDVPVDLQLSDVPSSFAFDPEGAMLTIDAGYLGRLDDQGRPLHAVPVVDPQARLAASVRAGSVYLIASGDRDSRLYRFLDDGSYQLLLQSDRALIDATDASDGVYAATARTIVKVQWPQPAIVFKAPDDPNWGAIRALAASDDGLLLFSTDDTIYALRDGVAVSIVNDSGGALRWRDGQLYVLDDRRHLLYALKPATMAMFEGAAFEGGDVGGNDVGGNEAESVSP